MILLQVKINIVHAQSLPGLEIRKTTQAVIKVPQGKFFWHLCGRGGGVPSLA